MSEDERGEDFYSPEMGDRRTADRTATVFRPVLIETEGFAGFCLLRNLSPNGMKGKVYTRFAEDMPVTVRFGQDIAVTGTIVWSLDGQVGVRFDGVLDVPFVLSSLAKREEGGKINRAPRLPIDCHAKLSVKDRTMPVEMIDISQKGTKVKASFVRPGDEVVIKMEGLDPRKAQVRWTQFDMAGLNFLTPLSFEKLAQWVIWMQSTAADNGNRDRSRPGEPGKIAV